MQKIGIVGAGGIAKAHIGNYKLLDNCKVVAVCDVRTDAARAMAELAEARSFASLEEMISSCELDAIDLCTPTFTHTELVKTAAKAGKHIFVEKPMARTVAEAQEAADAAKQFGVRLYVGQVLRWFPQYIRARETLLSGTIGDPVIARSSRCVKHPAGWFSDHSLSGGVVLDLIIHDFDWFRWCFGEVERVYAQGLYEKGLDNIDYALVTLKFKSGVIGHIEGSWARPGASVINLEIAGTQGLFNYDNTQSGTVSYIYKDENDNVKSGLEAPVKHFPMLGEIRDFVDGIENGCDFIINPEDGIEAVRIAECALESIKSGKPVVM